MADTANHLDFGGVADGAAQIDGERRKVFEAGMQQLGATAPDAGAALLELFRTLPAAMMSAQAAERDRLVALYGADDARVRRAEQSLAGLQQSEMVAARARVRATRALEQLRAPGSAFWGFVNDAAGNPLPGMAVQLVSRDRGGPYAVATTATDGFFRIPLPGAAGAPAPAPPPAFGGPGANAGGTAFTVQFLDANRTLVFEDLVPLVVGSGGAYREYQLGHYLCSAKSRSVGA